MYFYIFSLCWCLIPHIDTVVYLEAVVFFSENPTLQDKWSGFPSCSIPSLLQQSFLTWKKRDVCGWRVSKWSRGPCAISSSKALRYFLFLLLFKFLAALGRCCCAQAFCGWREPGLLRRSLAVSFCCSLVTARGLEVRGLSNCGRLPLKRRLSSRAAQA